MNKPSELYSIQEPAAAAKRNTLHLKLICLHEPATARPIGRPWPRQHAWRDLVRQISLGSGLESGPAKRQQV